MTHQFEETGIFCYKNATNQIGTIIVQPKRTIKQIPILSDQFGNDQIRKHFFLIS